MLVYYMDVGIQHRFWPSFLYGSNVWYHRSNCVEHLSKHICPGEALNNIKLIEWYVRVPEKLCIEDKFTSMW